MTAKPSSDPPPPRGGPSSRPAGRAMAMASAVVLVVVGAHTCGQWLAPRQQSDRIVRELADERALGTMTDWLGLPVLRSGRYRQQSSEDRHTGELAPMALWQRGNRDMNNFVCAGAKSDPPGGTSPFVLDLDGCPESYVRGYVMARFEGSGRLARSWLTALSFRKGPPDREVLRIYVDDGPQPVVEAALSRVLDGSAGEMFAMPFGAGSTRRLAWYYPVVFGDKLIVSIDHLEPRDLYFHQTAVVLDDARRPRTRASRRLAARDDVQRALRGSRPVRGTAHRQRVALRPGDSVETHHLTGPATVVEARTTFAQDTLEALAEVTLQVRWDHAARPAVDLPLSLLFGAADGPPTETSLALGATVDNGKVLLSLRLPMPFASQARWRLTNRGSRPVVLGLELHTVASVPSERWGYFTAQHFTTTLPLHSAHPLARATGRGRLVGVCLAMRGHGMKARGKAGHPFNFLEGDELGIVDGARAIPGTGTEDYFNGAFYFEDGPGATPFAQTWAIRRKVPGTPGQARASACRWHVLGDAIDFAESLELDMEVGPGDPSVLDRFVSVAFLYLSPTGRTTGR